MYLAETDVLAGNADTPVVPVDGRLVPRRGRRVWSGSGLPTACLLSDVTALVVATLLYAGGPAAFFGSSMLLLPPVAAILLAAHGMYAWGVGTSPMAGLWRGAEAVASAAMVVVVVAVAAGSADPELRETAWTAAIAFAGIVAGRGLLAAGHRRARTQGVVAQPALIVGAGAIGARIARRLLDEPGYGLQPVGFLDARNEAAAHGAHPSPLPLLGTLTDLPEVAAATGARQIIIAFSPAARDDELCPLVEACEGLGMRVSIVPRLFDAFNHRTIYGHVGGLPLIGLRPTPRRGARLAVKRCIDAVGALAGLILLGWLMVVIALVIRLDSPGPVLFRQRRVGRDGREFHLLKFRTMKASEKAVPVALAPGRAPGGVEGTDRRTSIGRLLRRTSLDELPQLINILRGEMSLVGPRPERPEFVELFASTTPRYRDRLRMPCGLTGWAQVHGLRGQTSLDDRVEWDNYYIEHWSLWLDVKTVLMTIVALFRGAE